LVKDEIYTVSFHPGLVDTDMTSVYYPNSKLKVSPEHCAIDLCDLMVNATKDLNGKFVSFNKRELKW
jgi:hypothetical protein